MLWPTSTGFETAKLLSCDMEASPEKERGGRENKERKTDGEKEYNYTLLEQETNRQ